MKVVQVAVDRGDGELVIYLVDAVANAELVKTASQCAGYYLGASNAEDFEDCNDDKVLKLMDDLAKLSLEEQLVSLDSTECCSWEIYAKEPLELTAIYIVGQVY